LAQPGLDKTLLWDGPKDQTSDAQLRIGESRDSGFDAEPVIGPRFARTRWHRPGMTAMSLRLLFEKLNWEFAQQRRTSRIRIGGA
jgi:hypothetical protein